MESDVVTMQDIFIAKPVEDPRRPAHAGNRLLGPLRSTGIKPQFLQQAVVERRQPPEPVLPARAGARRPVHGVPPPGLLMRKPLAPRRRGARASRPRRPAPPSSVRGLDTTRLPLVRVPSRPTPSTPGKPPAFVVTENGMPGRPGRGRRAVGRVRDRARDRHGQVDARARPIAEALGAAGQFLGQREAERPGRDRRASATRRRSSSPSRRHRPRSRTPLGDDIGRPHRGHRPGRRRLARRQGARHGAGRGAPRDDRADRRQGLDSSLVDAEAGARSRPSTPRSRSTRSRCAHAATAPAGAAAARGRDRRLVPRRAPSRRLCRRLPAPSRPSSRDLRADLPLERVRARRRWRSSADGVTARTGYAGGRRPSRARPAGIVPQRRHALARGRRSPLAGIVFVLILSGITVVFGPRPQRDA